MGNACPGKHGRDHLARLGGDRSSTIQQRREALDRFSQRNRRSKEIVHFASRKGKSCARRECHRGSSSGTRQRSFFDSEIFSKFETSFNPLPPGGFLQPRRPPVHRVPFTSYIFHLFELVPELDLVPPLKGRRARQKSKPAPRCDAVSFFLFRQASRSLPPRFVPGTKAGNVDGLHRSAVKARLKNTNDEGTGNEGSWRISSFVDLAICGVFCVSETLTFDSIPAVLA